MVLWTTVLLASVAGAAVAVARRGVWASSNRSALTRARWAAEACVDILLDGAWHDSSIVPLAPVDLGRGTRCSVMSEPAGTRLDLNAADSTALRAVLVRPELVATLLDWRDQDQSPREGGAEGEWYSERGRPLPRNASFAHASELRLVAGFDDSVLARMLPLVDVDVDAPVPLLAAPRPVLEALSGLTPESIDLLLSSRRAGAPRSFEEFHALLSPPSRAAMLERHAELARVATMVPELFDLRVRGTVDGSPIRYQIALRARVASGRLDLVLRTDR